MGSAKDDYERFVRWLQLPEQRAPDPVRRFANLVLAHFDTVAATSRQHNNRSVCLANLARRYLAATATAAPRQLPGGVNNEWPWKRLCELTVGPFRGFRRPESFDISKRLVLFFGPNGSGKTSVCDALEYALLGRVQEADISRIEQHQYLANIHARRFAAPRLTATDARRGEIPLVADPDAYRFCFVEKNRIDAFARLASRPPVARSELIAALFGIEEFDDLVSHFNDSMDATLVVARESQKKLSDRRQALVRDQQMVSEEPAARLRLDQAEADFAESCKPNKSYADLKKEIGTREVPGRLQELQAILNAVPPRIAGLTRQRLVERYEVADRAVDRHSGAVRDLERRSSQVAFKDLYTAVLALQASDAEHCPACDTALANVVQDPFKKARAGLQELKDLVALQEETARLREDVEDAARPLRADLKVISEYIEEVGQTATPVGRYLSGLSANPRGDRWWQDIYTPESADDGGTPLFPDLLQLAGQIETRDKSLTRELEERQNVIVERDQLLDWQRQIQELDLRRQAFNTELAAAKERVAEFESANATLIQRAEQEGRDIERDLPIKEAYDQFLPLLRQFRDQLPGVLIEGLNDLARDLYNEFNDHDHDADKLAFLHLPLTRDQRIEVAFRGEPNRRVDALVVLSEGHIRCLGLAILLAKSLSVRSPLIVFDDAVNAIDHDHRSGIRQAIFESDFFRDTQLVVTCHSNEFIKDIQNNLPQHSRNDWSEYVLRHHLGDYQPRVMANESRSYVAKARASYDVLDDREALSQARRALELLSVRIWKWLGYYDRGLLALEINRPNGEPTLRNLCEALRSKLQRDTSFQQAAKGSILAALNRILGIPAQNLTWTYLNKGTHEEQDRDDFDRAHVASVVLTLEELDALDLRRPRAA